MGKTNTHFMKENALIPRPGHNKNQFIWLQRCKNNQQNAAKLVQ